MTSPHRLVKHHLVKHRLVKHHGLGNDFLIGIDQAGDRTADAAFAVRACDRHRGIGADGLILTGPASGPHDATMHLYNADGSRAELSGNGIRCLAQAMVDVGAGTPNDDGDIDLLVATDAGDRSVTVRLTDDPTTVLASVGMGSPSPGPALSPSAIALLDEIGVASQSVATIDVGNPHLVIPVADPEEIDVVGLGSQLEATFAEGANIHFVSPHDGGLRLRVWERGAGLTAACGTGATASAVAANRWGIVTNPTRVSMPGGDVEVTVGDSLTLTGPAQFIASVEMSR